MTQANERKSIVEALGKGRELAHRIEQSKRPAEILMLAQQVEANCIELRDRVRAVKHLTSSRSRGTSDEATHDVEGARGTANPDPSFDELSVMCMWLDHITQEDVGIVLISSLKGPTGELRPFDLMEALKINLDAAKARRDPAAAIHIPSEPPEPKSVDVDEPERGRRDISF